MYVSRLHAVDLQLASEPEPEPEPKQNETSEYIDDPGHGHPLGHATVEAHQARAAERERARAGQRQKDLRTQMRKVALVTQMAVRMGMAEPQQLVQFKQGVRMCCTTVHSYRVPKYVRLRPVLTKHCAVSPSHRSTRWPRTR